VLHYELFKPDERIRADRYQQELTNLSDEFEEKWSFTGQGRCKVILLHDNAQSHIAKATRTILVGPFALGTFPARGV